MSKYHQAADVLKREAQRYAALNEAAKALDEIGSLDQAATEAKARAVANQEEADEIRAGIAKIKASSEKIKSDQAAKQKEADDIYAKTIFNANTEAGSLVLQAKSEAAKVVADATEQSRVIKDAVTSQISKLTEDKATLAGEINELVRIASAASTEADAAEKRLAKVRENIARLSAI